MVFSPKGWEFSAQGNALGFRVRFVQQPERLRETVLGLSQPFRLLSCERTATQGVALG